MVALLHEMVIYRFLVDSLTRLLSPMFRLDVPILRKSKHRQDRFQDQDVYYEENPITTSCLQDLGAIEKPPQAPHAKAGHHDDIVYCEWSLVYIHMPRTAGIQREYGMRQNNEKTNCRQERTQFCRHLSFSATQRQWKI